MLAINTENKVRMSDLILQTDIQTLAKSNSQLLDDAIALRYAQMEQGATPATRPVVPVLPLARHTRLGAGGPKSPHEARDSCIEGQDAHSRLLPCRARSRSRSTKCR